MVKKEKEKSKRDVWVTCVGLVMFGLIALAVINGFMGESKLEAQCKFTDIDWVEHNESSTVDCTFSNAEDKCPLPKNAECSFVIEGHSLGLAAALSSFN